MKMKPLLIACGLSMLLWGIVLYKCSGAPGAAAPPGHSQIGTSKSFDPHPELFHFRNSQHICFVQEWERADTNSQNDHAHAPALEMVNAIEYSELEKTHQFNNFHYVKYKLRCHILFGLLTCVRCGDESDSVHEIMSSNRGFDSTFGSYSQICTNALRLNRNFCSAAGGGTDRHSLQEFQSFLKVQIQGLYEVI